MLKFVFLPIRQTTIRKPFHHDLYSIEQDIVFIVQRMCRRGQSGSTEWLKTELVNWVNKAINDLLLQSIYEQFVLRKALEDMDRPSRLLHAEYKPPVEEFPRCVD